MENRIYEANKEIVTQYLTENQIEEDIYIFPKGKVANQELTTQNATLTKMKKTELQTEITSIKEQLQEIAKEALVKFENKEYDEEINTKIDAVKEELEFATLDTDSTISVEDNEVIVEFNYEEKVIEIKATINQEGQLEDWTSEYVTYDSEEEGE